MPTSLDRTTAAPFLSASPAAMAAEGPALERLAGELQASAQRGVTLRPLAGRQLAVIHVDDPELAGEIEAAAVALGARAALISATESRLADPLQAPHTLAVLRRLYDGLVCLNLPRELCERLGREAGLPVCVMACQDEVAGTASANRLYRIQAALVRAL